MPSWLLGLGKGLALGFVGVGVKFCFTRRALQKSKVVEQGKAGKILTNCFFSRYVVNLIILVLAFFLFSTNVASLIGTALGLTLPKYILYFKKLY
ncbi:MAG TPA: hypothetical protein GX532_01035 [Clostridia bacterium]|jgi:hypothetical protein|nr:hypothetical protein [Clostridia bacterium]